MGVVSTIFGVYFILAAIVAVLKLWYDVKLYASDECEWCEKYVEEKYGIKKKVYVIDNPVYDKIAFTSLHGIFVWKTLLRPENRDVLEAVLEHEVEHIRSHDLPKKSILKIGQYLITAYLFLTHGFLPGLASAIILGAIAYIWTVNREMSMLNKLKKENPEVFEKIHNMINTLS